MANEEVVIVSGNYRLGPLGFFTANRQISGNQGLRDQQLILQWVQTNIRSFGGDPKSITIMGHGSGASSVSVHMLNVAQQTGRFPFLRARVI